MSQEAPSQLKAIVDRGRCCGYGLCNTICPEVFLLDDDGLVYLDSELVSDDLKESAQEAVESCPAEAIMLEAVTISNSDESE